MAVGAEQKAVDAPPTSTPTAPTHSTGGVTRRRLERRGRSQEVGGEGRGLGDGGAGLSERELLGLLRASPPGHVGRVRLARNAKALNLSAMSLQAADLESLRDLLKLRPRGAPPLARVMLVGCGLEPRGVELLGESLHRTVELCLSHNSLGDDGVKLLCGVLKRSDCAVQEMGLCSNALTDACVPALLDALRLNRSLRILWLWDNQINDGPRSLLKQLEVERPGLEVNV